MSAEALKVSSVLDTSHLKVKFPFKAKYGNYINGKFVEPKSGKYFDNSSPISNEKICSVARSNEKDVEAALDAAHAAFPEWGKTDITTRSNILTILVRFQMRKSVQLHDQMKKTWKRH